MAGAAGVARASSVTNVMVSNAPTDATSAPTVYKTSFTATTGLSGAQSATVSITFPAITGLSHLTNAGRVIDNSESGQPQVGGDCTNASGTTETCIIFNGSTVNAGDTVTVELDGVVNSSRASTNYLVSVATSGDTTAAASNAFTVATAQSVSNVTVTNSPPTSATNARTVYKTTFTTSPTGGMSGAAGSTITLIFPSGTGLSNLGNAGIVTDNTTSGHPQVGGDCSNPSGTTETCIIFNGSSVAGGDSVTVELDGVLNPANPSATAPDVMSATTSSDNASSVASNGYNVTSAQTVSNVTVTNTPPTTATSAPSVYKTTFTTSSTGGLSGVAGSSISITFPSGTNVGKLTNAGIVTDNTTSGHPQVGGDCSFLGTSVTCIIFNGSSVAGGDSVTVELDGVVNPAKPSATYSASVSTSSDNAGTTTSSTFAVQTAQSVSNVTVTNSPPTSASSAPTVYKTTFTTSSTGGMSGAAGSTITLVFPTGTGLSKLTNAGIVTDNTTSGHPQVGGDCTNTSGTTETCIIFGGSTVNAGDSITVELDGVVNPATTSTTDTASVSTTSDHASATTSGQYAVVGQQSVTGVAVGLSNSSPGASGVTYKVTFTTSSSGGMSGAAGSAITLVFPSGTGLNGMTAGTVTDNTTSGHPVVGGDCFTASGTTENCFIFGGSSVNSGDSVSVVLTSVTNPTTTSTTDTVAVSTTSDQASVNSGPYGIGSPSVTGISPTSGPTGGGTSVTISGTALAGATSVKFGTASATNVTVVSSSQITATSPAGSGTVDVTVTTPAGTSATGPADKFTYGTPSPPSVTGVSPTAGPTAGGNTVTISGSNLAGATAVKFGTAQATINADTATSITVTAPGGAAGPVDVTVTTAAGTSATGAADTYTYTAAPTVTAVSPTSGPTSGGSNLTITGTNLTGATAVSFGSAPATSFAVNSATSITAVAPAQSAGTVDVTVTTPGGTSGTTAADHFTYNAPQPSLPPPASPPSSPPAVSGGSPTTQTTGGAAVSGTVNPESLATTAFFEYGLDPSERGPGASTTLYDHSTPVQQVGADSASHTVSAALTGLVPGALYHVRLVATNSAGTTLGTDATFTTPQAPAPAPPVLGKTQNAVPVTGTVFIRSPSGAFVRLTGAEQIPSGAEIDALHGSLKITTATVKKGKTQQGVFGGAVFTLTQARGGASKGLATLSLVEGAFGGAPSFALCKPRKALDAAAASSKTLQLLHASAHGKFRTKGRYSAATVLGTKWTIADRCDGTLVHDVTDSVAVTDFVRHKTIILHAGQSYLAKAKP